METDDFERDDDKAAAVLRDRGVWFGDATLVFDDPHFIDLPAREHPETTTRTVGLVDSRLLTVVHENRGNRTRIVTAWFSDKDETDAYQTQAQD